MELDVLHVSPLYSPPTGRVPLAIRILYYGPSPIFFPQNPSGHQHPLSTFCPFFWFTLSHRVNLCSLYRCRPNHPFPLIRSGLERCFTVFSVIDGLESAVLIRSLHPSSRFRDASRYSSPGCGSGCFAWIPAFFLVCRLARSAASWRSSRASISRSRCRVGRRDSGLIPWMPLWRAARGFMAFSLGFSVF